MSKYGNKPVWIDGIKFISMAEGDYYKVLRDRQAEGLISNLRLQVPYEVIPGVYRDVVKHYKTKEDQIVQKCIQRPTLYYADFVYIDNATGQEIVVDVKGKKTKEYNLKKKMMLAFLGIEITEIMAKKKSSSAAPKKTSSRPAPTKVSRPQFVTHSKTMSNGQPRPKKRG